ncbi:MAG: DNA-binding response regulator [Acidobacteria bacterium RIFCSPLOWO2_12_FULL_67_14]|nr:MAG: DNA-binding response regulator [Acidobacteria bacterium RIFCSPLOWO2_02_FULL_67_21]OFW41092.1 MAG: DNA-binding response regulator [Acidobacteria bacterium RIFCSPLOWO2_12_FULL_67_14]
MGRILIVEDERHIADGLRYNLEAEGHEATTVADGEGALGILIRERRPFDAVILDVMLPGKDGFAVASELRASGQFVPILMLTARGSAEDVLRGFEAGADDYLPKPFDLPIVLARVNGLLRRRQWNEQEPPPSGGRREPEPDVYTFEGRTIDFSNMEVRVRDRVHRLTVMECDLLRYLVRNAGQPVSRRAILQDVWGLHESVDTRAIDNFIVRLRRYLEDRAAAPKFLQTVRGVGYRFVPAVAPD